MESIWMAIAPGAHETRVLAMRGTTTCLLKARFTTDAKHPRALPSLLEGLALWHGLPVRAALVVDDQPSSFASSLVQSTFDDFGASPLYTLDWIPTARAQRRRHRRDLAMGEFRDLERRLVEEIAR